jgi:uncharacterized protein
MPFMAKRNLSCGVAWAIGASCCVLACQKAPEEPVSKEPPPTPVRALSAPSSGRPQGSPCIDLTFDKSPAPAVSLPPASACPKDPDPPGAAPLLLPLRFVEANLSIKAELARTPAETTKGLMYRTTMPADQGMLFRLGERRLQAFWMRNTCLPLDMFFIDEDETIVGIVENVPVLNEEERKVSCPSRYVLETNAGWARSHGVRPGQHVVLPSAMR